MHSFHASDFASSIALSCTRMASTRPKRSDETNRYFAHYERGWALYLRGDYDGALASVAQMAALDPDSPSHAYLHALIAYGQQDFAESLRLSELSSVRNPDYYGYHGLAADAALRLADHTRALHHVHAGLACGRLPPLQLLSFVVMEGTALFRLDRRQEAAERLMTVDAHPVIQAFVAESQLDDFTNTIHGLCGDELSSADLNELVASISDRVLQIANLWLLLKEDRGGSLLCALLRRYPSRRDDVESLARFYDLDDRRRALHGLPEPDAWTTAPAPETCTNPPARPPDATLPDAVVPPADTSKVLDMGQAVTDAPEVLDTDRANLEAVPLADALEVLDKDHANTRRASLADRRASLLIELLRGRLDELTFGDLYLLLDTRLGEGLAERRLRELFPTAPAEDSQRSNPRAKEMATQRKSYRKIARPPGTGK